MTIANSLAIISPMSNEIPAMDEIYRARDKSGARARVAACDGAHVLFADVATGVESTLPLAEFHQTLVRERFTGYIADRTKLPVKQGDKVVIPKGTTVKSTHPQRKVWVTKRKMTITVVSIGCGMSDTLGHYGGTRDNPVHVHNPTVCWAGTGGYWCDVDINDLDLEA